MAISNNADRDRILATVVAAIYAFVEAHPFAFVYATGSTKSRTRLYRIGINRFYKEIIEDFNIYGQIGNKFYKFERGKEYSGFLAQRKIINLHT